MVILIILASIVFLIMLMLLLIRTKPEPLIMQVRKLFPISGGAVEECIWHERYQRISNLEYASRYPNHTFDLYRGTDKQPEKQPVYIFVHGGGFCWGDKDPGDPADSRFTGLNHFFEAVLDAGFTLISMNYAMAPDCLYPTPVTQLTELVTWLQKNADTYSLDMTNVHFGGGSAGGHIIGQFVNIQTNPQYAMHMEQAHGIVPVLHKDNIRSMYFGCALLDNERFGHTGDALTNYVFSLLGRMYFRVKRLEKNPQVQESNVITYVTNQFPPSFITDGNTGTFQAQARDLEKKLTALGIEHKTMIFDDPGAEKLVHGFDEAQSEKAEEVIREAIAFVKTKI